jgi:hypothetical protein
MESMSANADDLEDLTLLLPPPPMPPMLKPMVFIKVILTYNKINQKILRNLDLIRNGG